VMKMTLSRVSVMGRSLVIAALMVPGGFAVMASCVFVVFGCLGVVFSRLLGHVSSLNSTVGRAGEDCSRMRYGGVSKVLTGGYAIVKKRGKRLPDLIVALNRQAPAPQRQSCFHLCTSY